MYVHIYIYQKEIHMYYICTHFLYVSVYANTDESYKITCSHVNNSLQCIELFHSAVSKNLADHLPNEHVNENRTPMVVIYLHVPLWCKWSVCCQLFFAYSCQAVLCKTFKQLNRNECCSALLILVMTPSNEALIPYLS